MTGPRRRHGEADGLEVAHFTHQYDVRVLTQGRSQGVGETLGIAVDFRLIYQTLKRLMNKLHRIFKGQDMAVEALIEIANHRRQRGRFAAPRRPRHQNQAILALE